MKRISNRKPSSGAGLDLTTARRRSSSSHSTHKTNSESIASDAFLTINADVTSKKKSARKVRCTQDFNQIDRRSIFPSKTPGSESVKKVTTKKKKNLDFLPSVCLELCSTEKENFSPNMETGSDGDGLRTKKHRKKKDASSKYLPRVEVTEGPDKKEAPLGSLPRNGEATPEEKRDSEIVFKKRKKKSKKTKKVTSVSQGIAVSDQIELKNVLSKLHRKSSILAKKSSSAETSIQKAEKQQEFLSQLPVDCVKHSISSGDVYIEETNQTFTMDQSPPKSKINPDLGRKSVRFRSTFEVQDITDISGLKSISFEGSCRDKGSFKRYRKSPHVSKLSNVSKGSTAAKLFSPDKADQTRENIAVISPSIRENVPKSSSPKPLQNRRTTFEMPSPIMGPSRPRQKSVAEDVSIIDLVTPSPKENEPPASGATPSKLLRESTFTMDEREANRASTSIQPLDVSRSNGRRRWDKSLGVCFLDGSGILHSISPPWTEEPIDLSVSKDIPKEDKKMSPKQSVPARRSQKGTNLSSNKKHSLRFELLKEGCSSKINESKNGTLKRLKMPNFALIHQRAFDKLENLHEMSERKAARAKLLLSGLKPASEAPTKAKSPAKSKKMLHYSPKPETRRLAKTATSIAPSMSNPKVPLEKKSVVSHIPKSAMSSIPKMAVSNIPKAAVSHIPKPGKNKNFAEKQKFTKLGFKVGADSLKKITKEEQVKAVVNKSNVQKNTVDARRGVIQNVRSNRRFELLMKMRNK